MDDMEIQDLLEQTATEFNEAFAETEYPEINLGEFLTITQEGNRETERRAYGEITGTQDLDNGLVDENTTSLETEDVNIKAKKMAYLDWGKAVVYTQLAIIRANKLGLKLDTVKLDNLRAVALRTIQKTVMAGHAKRKDVTGMINNASVDRFDLTGSTYTALGDMTGPEARQFMLNLVRYAFEGSGSIVMPNTIAIDSADLMYLSGLYDNALTNGQSNINALTAIRQSLNEYAGINVDILGIPMGFAAGKGKGNNNRAIVYLNDKATVYTDWALAPSAGQPFQRSSLSWEIPVEAQFTGAIISQLDRYFYVDYKSGIPATPAPTRG